MNVPFIFLRREQTPDERLAAAERRTLEELERNQRLVAQFVEVHGTARRATPLTRREPRR